MPPRPRQALSSRVTAPLLRTAPVLAVLVCHDGAQWLRLTLSALRHSAPRPRHIIAVDTGSMDDTPALLAAASTGPDRVIDGVITLRRGAGYPDAVHAAVEHAVERWGDPGGWIWLLHDDSAPDPDCLHTLLLAAEVSPAAGVLGPLAVDWHDPRLVVEAGLSTDASGHRQTGIGPSELDWDRLGRADGERRFEQSTEVLAVPSAGMLARRDVWERLGGFDRSMALLREDIDFGWRVNKAGHVVLCVPAARIRHARAVTVGRREIDARATAIGPSARTVDRGHGLRTFLVNCSTFSFVIGLPRVAVLCVLRALGFAVVRRLTASRAELSALSYLLSGRANLREARATRAATAGPGSVRGLFTSRFTRLRNAARGAVSAMIRRRVAADAALGRLPSDYEPAVVWLPPEADQPQRKALGPDALPAGALVRPRRGGPRPQHSAGLRRQNRAGLRRPHPAIAVPIEAPESAPAPAPRPSPVKRDGTGPEPGPDLVLVRVDRGRVLRQILLSPPLLLLLGLAALALVVNGGRIGIDLAGGRLLPVGGLGATWSEYVSTWHGVAGGTAAPAPAALAVLGVLGGVLAPFGGPAAVVALLLLADLPLAGLSAYLATRRAPVRRWVRALLALGYALLPPASAAVAQGRLDVVVVHVLLPLVTAGVTALLARGREGDRSWLSTAAGTALGLAVLGAFAPLVHLLLVLVALAGFVLVPGNGARRGAALFLLVLMPLALLLPWPAVVIAHPGVVLHGVGAWVREQSGSALDLLTLHAGGPGAWPVVGLALVLAVAAGMAVRPHRDALPGLGLALVGVLAVVLVQVLPATPLSGGGPQRAWAGAPLLVVGWGLVLALVGLCRTGTEGLRLVSPPLAARIGAVTGVALLGALAVGVVVPGRGGPLDDGGGGLRLASPVAGELADTRRSVLVLSVDGQPVRQVAARSPRFGDDDLAPVPSATARLAALDRDLRSDDVDTVRAAVGRAAATGVLYVVLPSPSAGEVFRDRAGRLVSDAATTSDGRPVFRVLVPSGSAYLLSPEMARLAVSGGPPPASVEPSGMAPVEASPPEVAVRVSDGPEGRLLVVPAEEEPGWRATIDGKPAAVVRAWGSSVAVVVPTRAAEVRVEQPTALRGVLLLVQGAVALFVLLTSIPGAKTRRR
ncbi:glycosyltransferase family 2 protein [Actinokineospora iranica]|uniref:Glycosyltransferase, GT2 family n=1 Tax=Actinokineospora iranica TaxID=1271860 RepID=A0A1G6SX85_9PSEU|nr:glycosyltransferase family 2 protein [Actinokineospora iranica]SDD21351.1 Glycosyltransferase, GT2 family [Actinokineospora iranica]